VSFIDTFLQSLRREPERPLVIEMHGSDSVPVRAKEIDDLVARGRGYLRTAAIEAGDRVVLLGPNGARWIAADIAILAEGAIVVPLYVRQQPTEMAGIVRDCAPALVIVADAALKGTLGTEVRDVRIVTFDELFERERTEQEAAVGRSPDDTVTIVYTSGTSGEAKGVMLTARNVDFMLQRTGEALEALMGSDGPTHRVFHYLPFCFAGSRVLLWTCLRRANPITLSTDLQNLSAELKAASPHYVLNVPMLLERIKTGVEAKIQASSRPVRALYEAAKKAHARGRRSTRDVALLALARAVLFAKVRRGLGGSLRAIICGSAPLHEDTQRWFEMVGLPVLQVYGLTETTAIVTMDDPANVKAGYVGRMIPGCELRVGPSNELLVRGPNVFCGYWNRADATRDAFVDGWFRTGDQVEVDDQGHWRVLGRVKNVLVLQSGHNVAPEPLEEALAQLLPEAGHIAVVGHGRPYLSVVVSPRVPDQRIQAAIETVNTQLPHYQRIRAFVPISDEFTPENGLLTANQKLRRRELETRFSKEIERSYAEASAPKGAVSAASASHA
jgi:long-chain acyl-CoA synthetase